ncbi:helix-turn-helix domain-containing protein [Nocardia terrae]|uniref:helix-turn-helix domain-containing protein n=1 Tax=Nocardia terrae TaxID=2675851 RepID=UPI0012FB3EB1|nr:helix-turn-helix domain-containing protein [Nocardia terrae]
MVFGAGGKSPKDDLPQPPSFGSVLRRLREERGVSRERLAFNAGVSASYVTSLEKGDRAHPTREIIEALARCLERLSELAPGERRLLFDLAGLPDTELPDMEDLRADLGRDIPRALELYEPHLAAYVDTRLNILYCNSSFAQGFPGLRENGNLLRWMLTDPAAKDALVEWDREVRIAVQWLHGFTGEHANPSWAEELLAELGRYPLFRELWSTTTARYERERPIIRLRDGAGRSMAIVGQLFRVPSTTYPGRIQIFIGLRR